MSRPGRRRRWGWGRGMGWPGCRRWRRRCGGWGCGFLGRCCCGPWPADCRLEAAGPGPVALELLERIQVDVHADAPAQPRWLTAPRLPSAQEAATADPTIALGAWASPLVVGEPSADGGAPRKSGPVDCPMIPLGCCSGYIHAQLCGGEADGGASRSTDQRGDQPINRPNLHFDDFPAAPRCAIAGRQGYGVGSSESLAGQRTPPLRSAAMASLGTRSTQAQASARQAPKEKVRPIMGQDGNGPHARWQGPAHLPGGSPEPAHSTCVATSPTAGRSGGCCSARSRTTAHPQRGGARWGERRAPGAPGHLAAPRCGGAPRCGTAGPQIHCSHPGHWPRAVAMAAGPQKGDSVHRVQRAKLRAIAAPQPAPPRAPAPPQVVHLVRHGRTRMNEFLATTPYESPGFRDPLEWVCALGGGWTGGAFLAGSGMGWMGQL
jgi:hypothetical protein